MLSYILDIQLSNVPNLTPRQLERHIAQFLFNSQLAIVLVFLTREFRRLLRYKNNNLLFYCIFLSFLLLISTVPSFYIKFVLF